MKTLLQIGAGNIGRACVGRLFSNAGYKIIFSDINRELISLIAQKQEYYICMVGKNGKSTVTIKNADAIPEFPEAKTALYCSLSMVTTAVGVNILPKIAPLVADVIMARHQANISEPLNIVACENSLRASSQLKEHVLAFLDESTKSWLKGKISFPDAATDCIVPPGDSRDPLTVTGEDYAELIIEKSSFLGTLPAVEGLLVEDNLDAFIERKLFTLNTGHAITAYLGFLAGKESILDAISEPNIRESVTNAMKESGAVLIHRYGFDPEKHSAYIKKIISRFENPFLKDLVARVGREPLRKLSYNDRLIKPLRGTLEYNLPNEYLIKGVKAALSFQNPCDPDCEKIQNILRGDKLQGVLSITGLQKENFSEFALAKKIASLI